MARGKSPKADRIDGYEPKQPKNEDPWASPAIRKQLEKRAKMSARLDEQENFDGFVNALTGLGDYLRDKTLGGSQTGPDFIVTLQSGIMCENFWRGSDLGGRIVETIPDEMTREGWEVTIQPDEDDAEAKQDAFPPGGPPQPGAALGAPPAFGGAHADPVLAGMPDAPPQRPGPIEQDDDQGPQIVEALQGKLEELSAADVFWEALCYERAYGGAGVLMGIDDGQTDLSQPLDDDATFDDVTHLTAFRGGWDGELIAWSYYRDPTQANYGMPEIYMLRNLGVPIARIPAPGSKLRGQDILPPQNTEYSTIISWIHESRLLIFPGVAVSRRARVQMRGWGDSVFTRVQQVLSQYDQTWQGIANLMTDFSQGVLKVEGLTAALMAKGPTGANGGGLANVTKKAMSMNLSRSIARVMMLDAKDDFGRDTVSLAGIADTMEQFALRLAAAADMPVDLLMGQGAGGALNKGDTTYRFFMDRVAARQKKRMLPQLRKLIRWVFRSGEGPTEGQEPEKWTVKMAALYQESDTERAARQFQVAQADHIYITDQVVTPEEVAATRFGGSEYNDGPIVIDFEGRQKMADQDAADKDEIANRKVQSATENQKQQEEDKKKAEEAAKKGPPADGEGEPKPGEKPQPGNDKGGSHKVTIAISKGDSATDDVRGMLADDFPPDTLDWVGQVQWKGPEEVSIADIDYSDKTQWSAYASQDRVEKFTKKIKRGQRKPVVLVKLRNGKYQVVDGHHRALAYLALGETARAYCAEVPDEKLYAKAMATHDYQKGDPETGGA